MSEYYFFNVKVKIWTCPKIIFQNLKIKIWTCPNFGYYIVKAKNWTCPNFVYYIEKVKIWTCSKIALNIVSFGTNLLQKLDSQHFSREDVMSLNREFDQSFG